MDNNTRHTVLVNIKLSIWGGYAPERGLRLSIVSTESASTPFTEAVIAQLNAEIGASSFSKRSLAQEMGEPYGTILRYLNGERDLPVWVLGRILEVLKVDPEKFMQRAKDRLAEGQ